MTCRTARNLCAFMLLSIGFTAHANTLQRTEYGYYNLRDDTKEIYQISLGMSPEGQQLEITMSNDTNFRYRGAVIRCDPPNNNAGKQHIFMLKPLFFQPDSKPHIGDIQNSYLSHRLLPNWLYTTADNQKVLVGNDLKLIMLVNGDIPQQASQVCDDVK